ncbi:hypothetical protein BGZ59_007413 [Podila verticillata]|nr:hypothetical protein BGZ59_007413 [Podila verticillata]
MNPLLLPELIALVADYFNFDEAVSPSLVCRVWNVAFGPIVWRSYLIDAKTHTNDYSIPAMSRNAPHIRHLTCEEVSSIGQYMIPCMKLRDLTIWQDHRGELLTAIDPAVEWGRFSKLIRQNPQLNKVTISVAGRPATYDFWAAASSIARVEISNIQMDEQDIQTFWTGCKNIQELSIDSIRPIDNVEFFAGAQEILEQGCLPRLEDLTLTYNFLDAELSSCLRALAPLKRINCSWSKFGPQAMAALESHYATLESLKLSECTQLTGNMIQKVLESCPLLTELFATDIHAPHIQRGRPWVCLGLKRLSVCVFVDSRTAKSVRKQSQAVFEQLGRLTRLEMLTVGMNKLDVSPAPKFQGLDFRLESGMDQLELKALNLANGEDPMVPSHAFHRILCNATKLIHLCGNVNADGEESRLENSQLQALDAISSPWACASLKTLRVEIAGIPIPCIKVQQVRQPRKIFSILQAP